MSADSQSRFGFGFGCVMEQLPWVQRSPAMREKVSQNGERRFRVVEFAAAFREPNWCTEGHVGYVLAGDRKSGVQGKSGDLGGRRIIKKKREDYA